MEKSYVSMFLLLIVISCALAKDAGKKDTKDTTAKPKLPQTLSRGKIQTTEKKTPTKLKKKVQYCDYFSYYAVLKNSFSCNSFCKTFSSMS